jgi:hypothetical protein
VIPVPPGPRRRWKCGGQGKGDELIAKYNLIDDADTDDLADSDPDQDGLDSDTPDPAAESDGPAK